MVVFGQKGQPNPAGVIEALLEGGGGVTSLPSSDPHEPREGLLSYLDDSCTVGGALLIRTFGRDVLLCLILGSVVTALRESSLNRSLLLDQLLMSTKFLTSPPVPLRLPSTSSTFLSISLYLVSCRCATFSRPSRTPSGTSWTSLYVSRSCPVILPSFSPAWVVRLFVTSISSSRIWCFSSCAKSRSLSSDFPSSFIS